MDNMNYYAYRYVQGLRFMEKVSHRAWLCHATWPIDMMHTCLNNTPKQVWDHNFYEYRLFMEQLKQSLQQRKPSSLRVRGRRYSSMSEKSML